MMSRTTLGWVIGAWTVLAWGGRIAIVLDTGSDPWDRVRIFAAVVVGVMGMAAAVSGRMVRSGLLVFAVVTAAVWLRSVMVVVTGDASAAFVTVHLVLAAVSLALSGLAVVTARQPVSALSGNWQSDD